MTRSIASAIFRRRFKQGLAPATLLLATLFGAGIFSDSCFAQANRGDDKKPSPRAAKPLRWLPIPAEGNGADVEEPDEKPAIDDDQSWINWKLLAFPWDEKPDARKVVRVRVVFYKHGNGGFDNDSRAKPYTFDKEFSDPKTVGLVQLGLSRSLRPAQSNGGAPGNSPIGQIQVMTNREVFKIGMQEQGFGIGSEYVCDDNEFYSPVLANLVQDIAKGAKLELVNSRQFQRAFEGMTGDGWRHGTEIDFKELAQRLEKTTK